ncbi:MAG: DUF5690 family protein [Odoribacter sp.]|nr:DUF5690 family protein [Odoribacter sp.]
MSLQKSSYRTRFKEVTFVLWAGLLALFSYSLVYALRKPFTAATFDGQTILGMDYKVAVTVIQICGYLLAKFAGIKLISEMKRENRLKFILGSICIAELSLVAFGLLNSPYNIWAMFFNGLSLGCMWGVIFSYIEGRKVTDLLASLLGISIIISSGTAKSIGLFCLHSLHINEFWMPALIGAFALPLLALLGYLLNRLPAPNKEDIEIKAERQTMNGKQRKELYFNFMPVLTLLFVANLLIVILRDIKEDFLVNIFNPQLNGYSSWLFAQMDGVVTLIILFILGMMFFVKNNKRVLFILLGMVTVGTAGMAFISFYYEQLNLHPLLWLFLQSLCLYITFLSFQTVFFDRFIACFRIKGNVGFFIALIDFIGYTGTVLVLVIKEFFNPDINWLHFYNQMAAYIGVGCCFAFIASYFYLYNRLKVPVNRIEEEKEIIGEEIAISPEDYKQEPAVIF